MKTMELNVNYNVVTGEIEIGVGESIYCQKISEMIHPKTWSVEINECDMETATTEVILLDSAHTLCRLLVEKDLFEVVYRDVSYWKSFESMVELWEDRPKDYDSMDTIDTIIERVDQDTGEVHQRILRLTWLELGTEVEYIKEHMPPEVPYESIVYDITYREPVDEFEVKYRGQLYGVAGKDVLETFQEIDWNKQEEIDRQETVFVNKECDGLDYFILVTDSEELEDMLQTRVEMYIENRVEDLSEIEPYDVAEELQESVISSGLAERYDAVMIAREMACQIENFLEKLEKLTDKLSSAELY